jgi:hypothetical protein
MRQNDDGRTVAAMDMLVPKVNYKMSRLYNYCQIVCKQQILSTIQKSRNLDNIYIYTLE